MNARESIAYLCRKDWQPMRLGLGRTRELCALLGNPQEELTFIHIAGTNGKGSTAAMTASILTQAGYKTGLYTSPYVQTFNERIQINGVSIPDGDLARLTTGLYPVAEAMSDHPTVFEMITALGFLSFKEEHCDFVVLEVGMGGEFDSTNVIGCPAAAVITAIGLDHTEYLGDTVEKIAKTKAGIIKPGGDTVVCLQQESVMRVFRDDCRAKNAGFTVADSGMASLQSFSLDGQVFDYGGLRGLFLPLLGRHQLMNASAAITTALLLRRKGFAVPDEAIRNGLAKTRWPVRFEVLGRSPLFIADGGHNPQCAVAMAQNLRDYLPGRKIVFLVGVLADKDYPEMFRLLASFAQEFVAVTPENPRALPAGELAGHLRQYGRPVTACLSVKEGIEKAMERAGADGTVVSFGSLYLSGKIRDFFS